MLLTSLLSFGGFLRLPLISQVQVERACCSALRGALRAPVCAVLTKLDGCAQNECVLTRCIRRTAHHHEQQLRWRRAPG